MRRLPILVFIIVFVVMLVLTQLLTYQQYKISKDKHKNELVQETAATKDRFRNILFNDITAARTLSIIYKQYGIPAKFDSTAGQILNNSRYAELLQITENGIVKNVYPDKYYKSTIGTNVNTDPVRKAEEEHAVSKRDIYFAGPRRLRFGDTGILGKLPIIVNNNVVAVATVLTRLSIIKRELERTGIDKKKFAYQLVKLEEKGPVPFLISDVKPSKKGEHIYSKIPEGNWLLRVSYAEGYSVDKFPVLLSGMGVLLSLVAGLLAYRKTREPFKLNEIIAAKTEQTNKVNKELSLLNRVNDIIRSEQGIDKLYSRICDCIIEVGGYASARTIDKSDGAANPVQAAIALDIGDDKMLYISARTANGFDEDEIIRLKQLAANLSIAVQGIQNRMERAESENRFRGAFEDSAIGMGLTSVNEGSMGRWIKVNRSLCKMLGYTEDELLSLTFMQITHPDDLKRDLAAQAKILRGASDVYRLEKRYIHKNGSIVWINLNVSLIKDKDKQPLYLVAQIENITEKRESQYKFQNLVENFIVGVYIIQNGKMVYVNPRIAEEMGYTEQDIINQPFEKFIYKDDVELVRENMRVRIEHDIASTARYEARGVRKDGTPVWFEILGGATLYHGRPALLGTMVNISERKAIYDELKQLNNHLQQQTVELAVSNADLEQSQKRYSDLFNFSPLPAWVADVDTLRFLDVNNAAIRHYGYTREEFLSMTLKEIRPVEEMPEMHRALAERSKQKEGIFRVTMTHKKKDGTLINVDIQVAPIQYSGVQANIAIATDITERQNYIKAIEAQNTRLREISWIQSHIVRAPLSRMMGLIPMLENSADDVEEQKLILNYLLTSAFELDETIKAITDKSKIEDFNMLTADIK